MFSRDKSATAVYLALMTVSGIAGVSASSVASIWNVDQRYEKIIAIFFYVAVLVIQVGLAYLDRLLTYKSDINVLPRWLKLFFSPWTVVCLFWILAAFAYLFWRNFFLLCVALGIFALLTAAFLNTFKVEVRRRQSARREEPLRPSLSTRIRPFSRQDESSDGSD